MTPLEIEQTKQEYLNICRQEIKREGIEQLLSYLENKTDFFTAPSSTAFHLNEDGGLCRHSLNVYTVAKQISESIISPVILGGESPFTEEVNPESLAIATLFHDLCKTKIYHKVEKWKKDDAGRWVTYPGYEIKDEFPFGHGEKSCLILSSFLRLKQDELLAIRWHMGMFEMTEQGSSTRHAYRAAAERSPLVTILQAADLLSANCLEKTTIWK